MTYKPYARLKATKSARQSSKPAANIPDTSRSISQGQRHDMATMLNEMHEHGKSWRWIAKYTVGSARFGWLQRIATGKRDVKPRYQDYLMVRRLYDQVQDGAELDGKRLELVLRLIELRAAEETVITALVRISQ